MGDKPFRTASGSQHCEHKPLPLAADKAQCMCFASMSGVYEVSAFFCRSKRHVQRVALHWGFVKELKCPTVSCGGRSSLVVSQTTRTNLQCSPHCLIHETSVSVWPKSAWEAVACR